MGKKTKALLAIVMLCCITLLSGCGVGDKFAGKWIGIGRSFWDGSSIIERYEITKNGEGYLIKRDQIKMPDYGWYTAEYRSLEPGKKESFAWDIKLDVWSNEGATAKGNSLSVDNSAGSVTFTYLENEKKLKGPDNVILQKYDEKVFTEFKNRLIEEKTKQLQKNFPGLTLVPIE